MKRPNAGRVKYRTRRERGTGRNQTASTPAPDRIQKFSARANEGGKREERLALKAGVYAVFDLGRRWTDMRLHHRRGQLPRNSLSGQTAAWRKEDRWFLAPLAVLTRKMVGFLSRNACDADARVSATHQSEVHRPLVAHVTSILRLTVNLVEVPTILKAHRPLSRFLTWILPPQWRPVPALRLPLKSKSPRLSRLVNFPMSNPSPSALPE